MRASPLALPSPPKVATLPRMDKPAPTIPTPRIFISATSGDLGSVRGAVAAALHSIGALAIEQKNFPLSGAETTAHLDDLLRTCHAVIHIAGHRYGAEDETIDVVRRDAPYAEGRRSYTQHELDFAKAHNLRAYIFLTADAFPYDPCDPETDTKRQLQLDHRTALATSAHYAHTAADATQLFGKIHIIREDIRVLTDELFLTSEKVDHLVEAARQQHVKLTQQNAELAACLENQTRLSEQILAHLAAQPPGADPGATQTAVATECGITLAELKTQLAHECADITTILGQIEQRQRLLADEDHQLRQLKVTALRKLGDAELAAIHYEKAIGHYKAAAALCDKSGALWHWCNVSFNLARALWMHGKYSEAIPVVKELLTVSERALGFDHPNTLTVVNNLAILLSDSGDAVSAESLYCRVLYARERTLGQEHPDTLTSLNNLATLLSEKGDIASAESLFRRALETREYALGPEHLDTIATVNNLASLLKWKGDPAAAEPLFRRALASYERKLGPEHPDTLRIVGNLALLIGENGTPSAAEPLHRRALAGFERKLGPEHPDTCVSALNLALLHQRLNDASKARPLAEQALKGLSKTLGDGHQYTILAKKLFDELKCK